MKHLFLLIIFVIALIFSCKKKEESAPPNITTTGATAGTTAGTTTGGTTGSAGISFNGMCTNQKSYSILGGTTYSITNAQNSAVFTNISINNFSLPSPPFLNSGNISLNTKIFKNNLYSYTDSTNTTASVPFVWTGTGSTVPAFTVTNNNNYATYSDYVYWPDTIKKSQSFAITFTGLHSADEMQVLIFKSGSSSATSYTALTSAGSVNIPISGLTALATTTTAIIQCNFYKNNAQTIGTNLINFRTVTSFIKTVQVKN